MCAARAMTPDELRSQLAARLCEAGIQSGERLVVAVSGGRDSMVLLHALAAVSESLLPLKLHVAHLNHELRPEADADAAFVVSSAAERGFPCSCESADVAAYASERHQSLELAARNLRLRFLESVRKRTESAAIALGHHANDQAETVLMRLLRGCSTTGLRGMTVRRDCLVRPLLAFTRDELALYARHEGVLHREDESNSDRRFLRNRIRHELIPTLERKYNPAIVSTLSRSAQLLCDEDDALREMTQEALETSVYMHSSDRAILAVLHLLRYHIAIQRRVLREILQAVTRTDSPVESSDVALLLEMAHICAQPLRRLKHDVWAQRTGDHLVIRSGPETQELEYNLRVPGTIELSTGNQALEARLLDAEQFVEVKPRLGEWVAAFDSSVATSTLVLRSARAGDRIQPLGMKGHKKLSDMLIDAKWPRLLRDEALVLERLGSGPDEDREIVWALGLRVCNRFRVTEETKKVLFMELSGDSTRPIPGSQ